MSTSTGIEGKVAVVTGGTDGIGLGIAQALSGAGARVVVASRREAMCEQAQQAIRDDGGDALGVATDVTDEEAVANLFARTVESFGGIDILVNCAGGSFSDRFRRAPLLELGPTDLIECYRLNVVSAFLCSTAAYPLMRARGGGSVINIGSVSSDSSGAAGMFAAYGASKAALNHITRSLAAEFAPDIRVNVVLPGFIDTPRTSASRTPERLRATLANIALGRIGTPDDIAEMVVFLSSPQSSWMTGSILRIDGGGGLVASASR